MPRRWVYDSVAITGSAIGLLSLLLGWLTLRPNRLAAGTGLSLPKSFGWWEATAIVLLWLLCFAMSLRTKERMSAVIVGMAANLIIILVFIFAGLAADASLKREGSLARVSLGAGIWTTILGTYIVIFTTRRELQNTRLLQILISWSGIAGVGFLLLLGRLDNLSLMREFLGNRERFIKELFNHIFLFGGGVVVGMFLGIPLGIWAARSRRAEKPVFFIANITQTVPSLALFGLLIAPLSALSLRFPTLRELGIRGVGATPALIALIIYSLLPIIRNTYVSLKQLDPAVMDAGRGMGMNRFQIFRRLEVPLATPLILEGVRTASVQGVGNAAVAALIGAGGLGYFIFEGLGQGALDLVILGALPIIGLALLVDAVMRTIVAVATPKGLMVGSQ